MSQEWIKQQDDETCQNLTEINVTNEKKYLISNSQNNLAFILISSKF